MAIVIPTQGYCEAVDVEALVQAKQAFSTSTTPTLAQVEAWITQVFDDMNTELRRAGFNVPITVIAAQHVAGTQLEVAEVPTLEDNAIKLKDQGGSLVGRFIEGDLLLIAGDTQYYAVTATVAIGTDNVVWVGVTPSLRSTPAVGADVTHTPNLSASRILKHANAMGVAARFKGHRPASKTDSSLAVSLRDQFAAEMKAITMGRKPLAGASRSPTISPPGTARVEKRG